jgi:serine/threonine protein phosphatase PrpC
MAVFDGHGENGIKFAEHCQRQLPILLSRKLSEAFTKAVQDISSGKRQSEDEVAITKRVLIDCFVILDETSPADLSGGSTATVIFHQGRKVYIANCGDSRSIVAVYLKNKRKIKIVKISREDKPELDSEKQRLLEAMGNRGEIIAAEKNRSSKIKFISTASGQPSATLSMSRSIGDRLFSSFGVIPNPIVDVLDVNEMVNKEIKNAGGDDGNDDVCVFAVSASDGMMVESLSDAESLASELAGSLFEDDSPYPLTALQNVIVRKASEWDKRNKGKFRDDITLAVTTLRTPGMSISPSKSSTQPR